jgi:hypothetical protein
MKLIIKGKMPTANEYIAALNRNRFIGAKMKKEQTERVYIACKEQNLEPIKEVSIFNFRWFVKNKKKDKDNIAFAKKFILDGLQMARIIKNDGWDNIGWFSDSFYISKRERVEIEIL